MRGEIKELLFVKVTGYLPLFSKKNIKKSYIGLIIPFFNHSCLINPTEKRDKKKKQQQLTRL